MTGGADWRRRSLAELRSGWPTLLGATLGVAVGAAALPFYTAGVFVQPLQSEFGWSRSQLSLAALLAMLVAVAFAPLAGLAIDRFGVRFPAGFSLLALAAGFAALGSMPGGFSVYLLIQLATFALAIASTPIGFTRAVNERFVAARGLALGITLCGTGIAATLAPPAVAGIIGESGWRSAYHALAWFVALATPVVLLLLTLGGRTAAPAHLAESRAPVGDAAAAAPALWPILRDPRFLRLAVAFPLLALGVSGFVLHLIPMLGDAGVPPIEAAAIQARLGLAVIAGRLVVGALVDHFFAPRVAALSLCITVAGMVAFALFGTPVATVAAFAIGFALGAEVDLIGYLTVRYFGLGAYGQLYGVLYGTFVLGTGLSPLLIARLQVGFGSYTPALWVCAALVAVAAALFATAPRFPATADA